MSTASRYALCFAVASLIAIIGLRMAGTLSALVAPASARAAQSLIQRFIDVPSFQVPPGSVALYVGPDLLPPSCQVVAPVQTHHSYDNDSPGGSRSDLILGAQAHVLAMDGNALVVDSTTYACGDVTSSISIKGRVLRCRATSLVSCVDTICRAELAPVCGVSADGARRSYRNSCEACLNLSLKGWFEGGCPQL